MYYNTAMQWLPTKSPNASDILNYKAELYLYEEYNTIFACGTG